MKIRAAITAVGGYLPDYVLNNEELEKMVDTTSAWITERTGIQERRILKNGLGTSFMGAQAAQEVLAKRGIGADEIDLVICATVTGDYKFPATANLIADAIGAVNSWSFDVNAACSGFIYALTTGSKFIETGAHKKVLVVGADKMSSMIDYGDRNTCIIFGDGAGAVLLEPTTEEAGIMDALLQSDGSGCKHLFQAAGGARKEASVRTVRNLEHYVYQEGKAVFKFAVTNMAEVSYQIMQRNGLSSDDVKFLVPHQANKRIIDACAQRMGLPEEKVMLNIQKYGNTTSGTIPLCLWEYQSQLQKGDNLVLAAFGGGFTWGAVYVKWAL
ncbi:MAG: ketoacyl-ACP synthase III [Bacteroidia bacterium]|nr:ketoacyl-ACP synthase III [Bacteroidia bacterium]